jgi:hypothetical protein
MTRNPILTAVLLCAGPLAWGGSPCAPRVFSDDRQAKHLARLEAMSASEKEELARKKSQYDSLPPAEKERLKALCHEIEAHSDAEELATVMNRYHQWLKTLSAAQLAELRDLPEPERLKRIKRLLRDQQRKSFLQIAREASAEDLEVVFEWNQAFVAENHDRILKALPADFGRRIAENPDKNRQTLVLMYLMLSRRTGSEMPRPGKEEVEKLIPRLSAASQKLFNETPDIFSRIEIISSWSWGALWSKAFPNVSGEQLAALFAKLPAVERDRLEKLPPKDREAELKFIYARMNFFRRGEGGGRLPWDGRDGQEHRPGPPRYGPSRDGGRGPRGPRPMEEPDGERRASSTQEKTQPAAEEAKAPPPQN